MTESTQTRQAARPQTAQQRPAEGPPATANSQRPAQAQAARPAEALPSFIESMELEYYARDGQKVRMKINDPSKVVEANIFAGRRNLRPTKFPPSRGYVFPLELEASMNFHAIGASEPFVDSDGFVCVMHGGKKYKRRELEAQKNERKKIDLPEAVKYSRGANRDSDPPEIIEKSDGDFEYVTLVIFKGTARLSQEHQKMQLPQNEVERIKQKIQAGLAAHASNKK